MIRNRIAVLVSGRGSNLMALHQAIIDRKLDAKITIVISSRSNAKALEYCKENHIPHKVFNKKNYPNRESLFSDISDCIDSHKADLIVLAGFMLLTPKEFTQKYFGRMVNIHPALLPSFPGLHAQKQAFDYGVKVTGCTVFFVDEGCDTGPIIIQKTVTVLEKDTEDSLSSRILEAEHETIWRACKLVLDRRTIIEGRRIRILEEQ
jgi:phosphoribosylglycinamide formyltransferase 1